MKIHKTLFGKQGYVSNLRKGNKINLETMFKSKTYSENINLFRKQDYIDVLKGVYEIISPEG